MRPAQRLAVVVPAYDEAPHIARVLDGMPRAVDHVVVVDDASLDGTGAIAGAHPDPRVDVVRHEVNRGVGAAIATGYAVAFAAGADVVVVMAGDGQMDPDDLDRVVAPVRRGEADYVTGDRLAHPALRTSMPWTRRLGNRALTALTRWATGLDVGDAQCGFTALSASGAGRLDLADVWPRYGYPNDLLVRATRAGLRWRRVVVRPVYGDEVSGVRPWDALFVVPFAIARALVRSRRRRVPASPGGVRGAVRSRG